MAVTYRPADDLLDRARRVAYQKGYSLQGSIDHALTDYLDRAEVDMGALLASLAERNREALDALADL